MQPKTESSGEEKLITVKGKFSGVQILGEKTHNRFVTKIKNLNYYQVDTKACLEFLKKKFDTTGSLRENGTEIML